MNKNTLHDAVYNASPHNANTDLHMRYGRGILVGVIAGMMGQGDLKFEAAIKALAGTYDNPKRIVIVKQCLPQDWQPEFEKYFTLL